ncbi:MAG: S8 family serine peptidase [Candidatus Kapaibacterium sp.]|nr:S8 family serine peptidase [Bacteroidota bacterium]
MKTLCIVMLLCGIVSSAMAQEYATNRLLVKMKSAEQTMSMSAKSKAVLCSAMPAVQTLNTKYKCVAVQDITVGKTKQDKPRTYVLTFTALGNIENAIQAYKQTGFFEWVEPDYKGEATGKRVKKKDISTGVTPNDAQFGRQWSLLNNGTMSLTPSKAGADVKMTDAWSITQGDSSVIVAILDTGCDYLNSEFNGRTWYNKNEIPGNGKDDDNNGFVDDFYGWNFAYSTNEVLDDYGHGTNVASIIGMNGNNAIGLAGVDWRCKLMNLKVLNNQSTGFYSWWASAIAYAVDNGANVINMSLGGTSASSALQDAITEAGKNNVTVVVSMGNDNTSKPSYPAACTGSFSVGCSSPNDTRTSAFPWNSAKGSNYGSHISVIAPGNYIYGLNSKNRADYTSYWSGTSQAAPHVSGLCALLLAQDKTRTPAQLRSIIEQTADDRVGTTTEDTPGFDIYYGYGRINAYRALLLGATDVHTDILNQPVLPYPNPTIDIVNGTTIHNATLQLYSTHGGLLQTLHNSAGNMYTLDIAQYPNGVYLLQITENGVNHIYKIVKE